jgi:HlyD family secretion protein
MKSRVYIKIILVSTVLSVVGFFVFKNYLEAKKFEYAGTLETTKVDIGTQVGSLITSITVREGDPVHEKQTLVLLQCEEVKLNDAYANTTFERNYKLFKSGTVSEDALDQIKNSKDIADARKSWCEINSPLNGTVLSRYREPGEIALVGSKILTLANIKDIWAYIYVPQPDIASLKLGQTLVATLPELGDRKFIGKVIKINEEAEFTPKNVQTKNERERLVFGVKVSFLGQNDDEILKPGMTIYISSLHE